MTSSPVSLSLHPSPSNEAASAEQLTLAQLLARITSEYGPTFANVTEEKLQAQINKPINEDVDMEDEDIKQDAKKLITREEFIKIVQVAYEESSLAQDFISLLLSSVRPAAGGASMSAALKSAVPLGALTGARILPQQTQKPDFAVSLGWKSSALQTASQTLLAAADRLAESSGSTGGFVEGVLKVRAAGWGIVQMPAVGGEAQQGVLKVFYGFQKAGSDYLDPGVGYLKESPMGDLVFTRDPKFAEKKDKMLRIRIEKKGDILSSFAGPKDLSGRGYSDVEVQLHKARDSLFDEELYHELTKEARVMPNTGVMALENEIRVPLADGSKAYIDLVDPAITEPADPAPLATAMLLALQTLLSHAHHLNLKKRQEIPEPLNTKKPQVRPAPLLRPILAFCTHNHLLGLAEAYFNSLLEPFKAARLPCSLEISRYSNLESISQCNTPAELLEVLLTTSQSTLILSLPADNALSLQIQTPYQLSQATYQWIHPFTLKTSSALSSDAEISFDALSDAESPIMLAVEESLSTTSLDILGPKWRKIEMGEFESSGRRIRVELRGQNHMGKIVVLDGSEEIECIHRSLREILSGITESM